jgi:N-acetylmuramoyl-L-alanine amidase
VTRAGGIVALALLAACRASPPDPTGRFPAGDAIVIAGARVPIDAPVVLWTMEPFYDAYAERPRFASEGEAGKRYRPGREARTEELAAAVERDGWTRAHLSEQVDLLVLHYDACGTSRACFRVLHDERKLSVHFLLDVDGTLYQTLDLAEQAWHARAANPRSIGVEIAHVGAFPDAERARFARVYEWTEHGTKLALTDAQRAGLRFPDYAGGPAREGLVTGAIHGEPFAQPDFTPAQYEKLAALAAALARELPQIALDAPRDATGAVRTDALSDDEEAAFGGILGHFHLQTDKRDPGPAFDWERLLAAARSRAVAP